MRRSTKPILLDTVDKVKDFVKQTNKFLREVDVSSSGKYVANGKSLLGILSLDTSKPVVVSYSEEDEGLAKIFISKYFVRGVNV